MLRKVDNTQQGSWAVTPTKPAEVSMKLDVKSLREQLDWLKHLPPRHRGKEFNGLGTLLEHLLAKVILTKQD